MQHKSSVAEASSKLYVSLSEEHRVSRSFRATWFIRTLLQTIDTHHHSDADDLGIISVEGGSKVTPATLVYYLCPQYSLVFVIDMSHNVIRVVSLTMATVGCCRAGKLGGDLNLAVSRKVTIIIKQTPMFLEHGLCRLCQGHNRQI